MNIYKISQSEHNGYDTFDSAIVAAHTEDQARDTHPNGERIDWASEASREFGEWCRRRESVRVELVGVAVDGIESGVIVASYNAG